ncbi:MAG: DUF6624 domain-containing protein [Candidatus Babeliales bacterium]
MTKIQSIILISLALFCYLAFSCQQYVDKDGIKQKLASMVQVDQELRKAIHYDKKIDPELKKIIDAKRDEHCQALKEILACYDWITIDEFGAQADQHAWLLVQHADHDITFQKEILARLEQLYPLGKTNQQNYAYLYDRVAINEHRLQRYGTQGDFDNGVWKAYPMEDFAHIDERRATVGLQPLSEYIRMIHQIMCVKPS